MLLLSIRPEYVEKIFNGEKQVELRRRRPRVHPGDWIAIYSSTPHKMLIGVVQIKAVMVAPPSRLWHSVKAVACLKRSAFLSYFDGSSQAVGIAIENPIRLPDPVSLDELRHAWPGFQPPQEFRYLTEKQIDFVVQQLGQDERHRVAA